MSMNLINGYARVLHHGKTYNVSPDRQVIYVTIKRKRDDHFGSRPGHYTIQREIPWNGPTGRFVRLKAGAL